MYVCILSPCSPRCQTSKRNNLISIQILECKFSLNAIRRKKLSDKIFLKELFFYKKENNLYGRVKAAVENVVRIYIITFLCYTGAATGFQPGGASFLGLKNYENRNKKFMREARVCTREVCLFPPPTPEQYSCPPGGSYSGPTTKNHLCLP